MSDFNKVILLGRIGNELLLKHSAQGNAYLKLSIATNSYKSGKEKTTHWHRVMVFGAQAEICARYLRKGSQVMVEGSLEVRTYNNAEEQKVTTVSVIASRVQFLGGRVTTNVESSSTDSGSSDEASESLSDHLNDQLGAAFGAGESLHQM